MLKVNTTAVVMN